ncbi:Cilia- and flagella-associated protein 43 [Entophlyctis luteolus]|nr:Cilia- and flagella-associated protein 43 [Entophlyctis luteolus]
MTGSSTAMPPTIFGELEVSKSIGHTPFSPPCYVTPNVIMYISGNAFNFIDKSPASAAPSSPNSPKTPAKLIAATRQITASAVFRKEGMIAFSERGSTSVKIVKYPLGSNIGELKQAAKISFNPLDSTRLCTSGGGEDSGIKFWKLDIVLKASTLKMITGAECRFDEQPPESNENTLRRSFSLSTAPAPLVPSKHHIWQQQQHVLVTSETKDAVIQYDPLTGESQVAFCVWKSKYAAIQEAKEKHASDMEFSKEDDVQERNLTRSDYLRKEFGAEQSIGPILALDSEIIVGGEDGSLRFVSYSGKVTSEVQITSDSGSTNGISSLGFSPDFNEILITAADTSIHTLNLTDLLVTCELSADSTEICAMSLFTISDVVVTAHKNGILRFWDPDSHSVTSSLKIDGEICVMATHPLSSVLAVGTNAGILRVYDVAFAGGQEARLLMRERISESPIMQLSFDPTGRFLIGYGSENKPTLIDILHKCSIVGWILSSGSIIGSSWEVEESEESEEPNETLALYLLVHESKTSSTVMKFVVPGGNEEIPQNNKDYCLKPHIRCNSKHRIEEVMTSFIISNGLSTRSLHLVSADKKIKTFSFPQQSNRDDSCETIYLGAPEMEIAEHEKPNTKLVLSLSGDWLFSYGPDGTITGRNFLEPGKGCRVFAHDSMVGGVQQLAASRDTHKLYTVGYDGIMRVFEWRSHLATTRRALIEAAESAELALEEKMERIKDVVGALNSTPTYEGDEKDSTSQLPYYLRAPLQPDTESREKTDSAAADEDQPPAEVIANRSTASEQILAIRDKLVNLMARNETLPELEKLEKHEFIIDFAERDRLRTRAEERVAAVRREIEFENLKKRVIRNRIKAECWDSMEVVGASVKSFRPDPVTTRIIEVTNYPIKKKSAKEIQILQRVKTLRKTQLLFDFARAEKETQSKHVAVDDAIDSATTETPTGIPDPTEIYSTDIKSLLFQDLDLTSNERKRTQIVLLEEVINAIKEDFNSKFKEFVKLKKDEIIKIEDKNERITNISAELQQSSNNAGTVPAGDMEFTNFRPQLDDDEVPERIITVDDSEVKAAKFIGPEERKRLEAQRKEEEERRRAAQQDNFRERGLMIMMNGKLDDKSEEVEKEELVKPDCMSKPRDEMNEEERKLVKEYEKKLATLKEEQEKYRKALETELKKLQTTIFDICDTFDGKLKEFLLKKMEADQDIYKHELKRIKLQQSILLAENDESKEWRIHKKLDELRMEKSTAVEVPEIKKELDRARDEHEIASRRDKEIEKQFKKEFSTMDPMFDVYNKLFRKREILRASQTMEQAEEPFPGILQKEATSAFGQSENIARLTAADITAAILEAGGPEPSQDSINKLMDLRDRKIQSEIDVKISSAAYAEIQALSQKAADDNERNRRETEKVLSDLATFTEYRFHATYNQENLIELKHGQVEVSQAPVVTDYSDAELIHRNVVEKLNESIVALGKSKVEALKEMKEYRKGIHALEWENKMLDFQAEDLIIRTRDIQLLRVTKQMQEYIRSGDDKKQLNEVIALEKRAEHNSKARKYIILKLELTRKMKSHVHKLNERQSIIEKYKRQIAEKKRENEKLEAKLKDLEVSVRARKKIHDASGAKSESLLC